MASCVISKCIKCEHRAISFVALAIAIYILSVTVHGANLWGLNYASYSIGMWVALYRKKILKFINTCSGYKMLCIFAEFLFLWMGLFGAIYFFLHNPTELVLRNILKGTISGAFIFALCSLIGLVNQKTCRLLEYIGTIAYEVYLINQRKTIMIGHSIGRKITMKPLFPEKYLMLPIICGHPATIQRRTDHCLC